jgi:hypothetical protein
LGSDQDRERHEKANSGDHMSSSLHDGLGGEPLYVGVKFTIGRETYRRLCRPGVPRPGRVIRWTLIIHTVLHKNCRIGSSKHFIQATFSNA